MGPEQKRGFFPQEDGVQPVSEEALRTPTSATPAPAFAEVDLSDPSFKLTPGCDDPGFRGSAPAPKREIGTQAEATVTNRLGRESTGG